MNTPLQTERLPWRLNAPFGVEVDADLSRPLTPASQREFRALLFEHGVLIARNQRLSMDDQKRLAGYIGPLVHPDQTPAMLRVDPPKEGEMRGTLESIELAFHADLAWTPQPFWAISLHALDVEPGRTSTRLASGVRACAALPPLLKNRLLHSRQLMAFPTSECGRARAEDMTEGWMQGIHPVIRRHPVTGAEVLFPNFAMTARIEGMPAQESEALLEEIFSYTYRPDAIYEHKWYDGDFVIWDNFGVQHGRPGFSGVKKRTLQRVCVGEKGTLEQHPGFRPNNDYLRKYFREFAG